MRLFAQLKHKQVYKFGAIYLAAAWLLTQVAVNIERPLELPAWTSTLVIVLLALGFPVVLILAWTLDAKPQDKGATVDTSGPSAASREAATNEKLARGNVRFCTTRGGIRLAYSRFGHGAPVLRTGNWVSHLELQWDTPIFRPMLRDLSRRFELVMYDGRGTGLSDRDVVDFSLETMIEDMEVVADANELTRFAILAYSQSCAVSIAYAARHPERVSCMVLYGGFAHNFRTQEEIDAIATLFTQNWGQANAATRQLFTSALFPDAGKDAFDAFNELQRNSISPENAARLFRACHAMDVRPLAKQLTVPTLVMHSRDEQGVSAEYGREMASLIPGARFVSVNSRNHLVLESEPVAYKQFIDETVAFVSAH
jgi:pimeloyl-ACP methyl ester carboxylesterase